MVVQTLSLDITKFVEPGKTHSLVVSASSDLRSGRQSAGKQSLRHGSFECMYTRTTGIWQTVWMEAVAPAAISRVKYITDIDRSTVSMEFTMRRNATGNMLTVNVLNGKKVVATDTAPVASGSIVSLPIKKARLWSPENPFLYDVEFELKDAAGNVIAADSSVTFAAPDGFSGDKDMSNLQYLKASTVALEGMAGKAAGAWAQDGVDMTEEFKAALVPGAIIEIEYSSTTGVGNDSNVVSSWERCFGEC